MIKLRSAVILFIAIIVCVAYISCKKDKAAAPTAFDLQYRVLNAHNTITAVSYVGAAGDTLAGDVSEQSDTLWSKVIRVAKPPFTAGLHVNVNNTTSSGIDFILQITVNGIIQNAVERSIPAQATADAGVVATIN
jgi:hypothetical protein